MIYKVPASKYSHIEGEGFNIVTGEERPFSPLQCLKPLLNALDWMFVSHQNSFADLNYQYDGVRR